MATKQKTIPLQGSTKHRPLNARVLGEAPAGEFQVTVMVRRRAELPSPEEHANLKPGQRKYLTRAEHAEKYGADPADIQKVVAFAKENGLNVVSSDAARRSVILSGNRQLTTTLSAWT